MISLSNIYLSKICFSFFYSKLLKSITLSILDYSSYFHFCLSSSLFPPLFLFFFFFVPFFFFLIKFNELAVDSPGGQVCAADKVTLHKRNFVNEPRAEQWHEEEEEELCLFWKTPVSEKNVPEWDTGTWPTIQLSPLPLHKRLGRRVKGREGKDGRGLLREYRDRYHRRKKKERKKEGKKEEERNSHERDANIGWQDSGHWIPSSNQPPLIISKRGEAL